MAATAPPPRTPSRRFDRSIVEGPIPRAVWRLAWPTMLQNMIGGLQGVVDHVMVGHFVGYTGNAAIGVSWQIFLVVVVFISSLFTGMSVLVARFAGQGDEEKVNRTVTQAFLTASVLSVGVMAPLGYVLAPSLMSLVNATPAVRAEALPYIRIMFVFSFGMMMFFMLGGALRSAGDARTPLRLGVALTVLNIVLNIILIRGLGPIPAFGTAGAAMGTVSAGALVAAYAFRHLAKGDWVVGFTKSGWRPDFSIIRALFRFGLPTGFQGVAMNIGGVIMLGFIGSLAMSAEAQAAFAVGYTELFSFITWTSVGLMGAAAAVAGQNLGAGHPDRSAHAVAIAARIGLVMAGAIGALFLLAPRLLLGAFGMDDPDVLAIGVQLLSFLAVSGLFITVALSYTGGLQGTGDTKSPLYITLVSQIGVPIGICTAIQATRGLQPGDIWTAILAGHATRCALSVLRFRQQKWRHIRVDIEPARP
jgi:putative MATE family efflux protein